MKCLSFTFLLVLATAGVSKAEIFVTLRGDTARVWDTAIEWSCSGSFTSLVRFSGDTIYVTERDTMPVATCLCYFDVSTDLAGLQPGSYTVVVTRRHEFRYADTVLVSQQTAGVASFTITSSSTPSLGLRTFQTPCRSTPMAVATDPARPARHELLTCFPNPFNPSTTIRYTVPSGGHVSLVVYNLIGQYVCTLENGYREAGTHESIFRAGALAGGVYVVYLDLGSRTESTRMILNK